MVGSARSSAGSLAVGQGGCHPSPCERGGLRRLDVAETDPGGGLHAPASLGANKPELDQPGRPNTLASVRATSSEWADLKAVSAAVRSGSGVEEDLDRLPGVHSPVASGSLVEG